MTSLLPDFISTANAPWPGAQGFCEQGITIHKNSSKSFLKESNSVVISSMGDKSLSKAALAITKPSAFESLSF